MVAQLRLSPAEETIVNTLRRAGGAWVPTETLIINVWRGMELPKITKPASAICVHISRIRRKMRQVAYPYKIDASPASGLGYRLIRLPD